MKVLELLDELQDEIEMSPKGMLSKKRNVDVEIVMEIIDDIREALPEDINEAADIVARRDDILAAAREEADTILNGVDDKVANLVERDEITQQAYDRAAQITDSAHENAREIREGVYEYADEVLSRLENDLERYIGMIRENRLELSPRNRSRGN